MIAMILAIDLLWLLIYYDYCLAVSYYYYQEEIS